MKQPTRKDTINLRVWRTTGLETMQGIVGVNDYPLAIHRPITEFEDIQQDFRTRYGGTWCVTHIPTGKSFGIRCRDWDALTRYIEKVRDHPTLLMITDETMTKHPMYSDLCNLHVKAKSELPTL
jgi:hypothetical protein